MLVDANQREIEKKNMHKEDSSDPIIARIDPIFFVNWKNYYSNFKANQKYY
jgi:hypothetical protein